MVVVDVCLLGFPNICSGGVPGGVLDGELLLSGCILLSSGGMQTKQRLLGLGPYFIPPQPSHGGVKGGVQGDAVHKGLD